MAPDRPPRIYYDEGPQLQYGYLVYRGDTPLLVVSWRSENEQRVPHVYYELEVDKLSRLDLHGRIYRYRGRLIPPLRH